MRHGRGSHIQVCRESSFPVFRLARLQPIHIEAIHRNNGPAHVTIHVASFAAGFRNQPQGAVRRSRQAAAFAVAKKVDPAVLLHSRLAPDMFDFTRQVQVVTDQARRASARLAGVEPPSYEDTETTIDELKARIARTLAFLKTLDPKAIDASAEREITFPIGPEKKAQMKGDAYLTISCCRIFISTTPPPTQSCVIPAWMSASLIFWARSRSS